MLVIDPLELGASFLFFCVCRYDEAVGVLVCDSLRVVYPIRHGLPMLTPADGKIQEQVNTPN